ncbi:hypothetical protein BK133_10970 [Paenibacillus sp. FSL H8-0548]|uniref:hypothetical protein n=1 Tax=Paenibacillus sp. FSL H8-0548 TaxID=1920422 RepID=UPI00096DB6CF|nr:hypothetical protein [Paenibacillus sp. FSL H8-0548]OMF35226.1 hypothetical protein BK133_10970 [Paenibacillus sp. FSL H8-0548]
MKEKQRYNPLPDKHGYAFHVEITHETLLTLGQDIERQHGRQSRDPDDSTDYSALDWYKNGSISFAEKDWNKLITRIRDHFKMKSPVLDIEGSWDSKYLYYKGAVFGLKGNFLKRDSLWIRHSATFEFDTDKFAEDLTRIGRWEK